jgi:hypothetical protein
MLVLTVALYGRLNPCKSEIGKISKIILSRINSNITKTTVINQWKNSAAVIEWFDNITNKPDHCFIVFDIVDFYPSITEELLRKAISFASERTAITEQEVTLILQCKETLLFNHNEEWCKSNSNSLFDVTMGSYDGAEVCELVGANLLSKLSPQYGKAIGLYRDDGLAAFNKTPKEIELIKKHLCRFFHEYGLKITIDANKKIVDYLDITLNLNTGCYMPYMKENNTILYVNSQSNHPKSVLNNIPAAINKRLSNISSSKQLFDKSTKPYQDALKASNYDHQLQYEQTKHHLV